MVCGGAKSFVIRCVLGLSGSAMFLSLMRWTSDKFSDNKYVGIIAKVGSVTLGIYCIQVIMAEGAFKYLASFVDKMIPCDGLMRIVTYDVIVTPLAALMTIVFSYLVIDQIQKNKYTRFILLGEDN